jgi:Ser/Thr protein kinase RdoA (MazF antagonist)
MAKSDAELMAALEDRARSLLDQWGLPDQAPELLKYRENAVFKVMTQNGDPAVLRLHRPGYVSDRALASELRWMSALKAGGLEVPDPLATLNGKAYITVQGGALPAQNVDLLSWLNGKPLGESGVPLVYSPDDLERIFTDVGRSMAELHDISDTWDRGDDFQRPSWNQEGFIGERPLWGRFWDFPGLPEEDRRKLSDLRSRLSTDMARLTTLDLDYGLIHADLVRENVLVTGHSVQFIDFDDCGFGWRMFDIATTLFRNRREERYELIKRSLLAGYRARRPLSAEAEANLPLFMLLRSLTYIGWIGERPEFPDVERRLNRYLNDAYSLMDELRPGV